MHRGQLADEDLHPCTDLPIGPEDNRVHLGRGRPGLAPCIDGSGTALGL
jgi:hypothetical protein